MLNIILLYILQNDYWYLVLQKTQTPSFSGKGRPQGCQRQLEGLWDVRSLYKSNIFFPNYTTSNYIIWRSRRLIQFKIGQKQGSFWLIIWDYFACPVWLFAVSEPQQNHYITLSTWAGAAALVHILCWTSPAFINIDSLFTVQAGWSGPLHWGSQPTL